jgi:hypothetical protein
MDVFENKLIKKAEIWADIKFVPADSNRETIVETTKKENQKVSKSKQIIFHLKQIWRILKNGK